MFTKDSTTEVVSEFFKMFCSFLKTFTKEQRRVFLGISLSYILAWCPGMLSIPFLPSEAARHNVTQGETGLLFGVSSVTNIITSPLIGLLTGKIGPKKVVMMGVVSGSLGSILMGLIQHVGNKTEFIVGVFVSFVCLGIGTTATYTASLTYAANLFSSNMNLIVGATEGYIGVGEVLALPLGGFLHDEAGFMAPFLVFGLAAASTLPLTIWLLPKDDMEKYRKPKHSFGLVLASGSEKNAAPNAEGKKLRPWDLFRVAPAFFMILVVVVNGMSWLFISTTFEPHIKELELSMTGVGSLFTVSPAIYIFLCPAWGIVVDKMKVHRRFWIAVVGLLLTGLTMPLFGPMPFLGIRNSIASNVIALMLVTVWLAAAFIPACELALIYCVKAGYVDNIETYAVVSGWISMAFAIGAASGSSLGGFLVQEIGYAYSAGVIGIISGVMGIVIVVTFAFRSHDEDPVKKLVATAESTVDVKSEESKI